MSADTEKLIAELRGGLEGTTKGTWHQCGGMSAAYRAIHSPSGYIVFGMADASTHQELGKPIQAPNWDEQDRNARHIARCSPDNIRALLDRIATLEKALAPFAKYMDGGMDLDNDGNEMPDEHGVGWVYLTYGDFRRAARLRKNSE
jgi:hypothetical protein